MDIIDQVSQLLSGLEIIERNRRAGEELGKAMLLQAAIEDYVDSVSTRNWERARGQLTCILMAVVNMIPALPSEKPKDG